MRHHPPTRRTSARHAPSLLLGFIAATVVIASTPGKASEAEPSTSLSVDALRKCSDARVSECQFLYGQALEGGVGVKANREAAKKQYEMAYQGGVEEAGASLLRLTRQHVQSTTAAVPGDFVKPNLAPPDKPNLEAAKGAGLVASNPTATHVTATNRNPGAIVALPALTASEYAKYRQCWKFVFNRAFEPSTSEIRGLMSQNHREIKEHLFTQLEIPDVRIVCQARDAKTYALLDGGRAVPLKNMSGYYRNNEKYFYEEFQTSPTETTSIGFVLRKNGREGEMRLGVLPLGKDARVARDKPKSIKWLRGDVTEFTL